ncbi:hypothetical protein [Aquincola agrisoli]
MPAAQVLQLLLVAACIAPFVAQALSGRRRAWPWWIGVLLAAAVAAQGDPLALALQRVDGRLLGGWCG